MTLLAPATTARLRRTALRGLADTGVVLVETPVPDGEGGFTVTERTGSTSACLLLAVRPSSAQAMVAGRLQLNRAMRLLLPHDAAVTTGNRLLVNGTRRFTVHAVERGEAAGPLADLLLDEVA